MNYEKIGKFIQEKRKQKQLTQKELAEQLGVTDKAVSKWERGLGCPDVSILEKLANILEVSILEILKGRKIENEIIKVTEANDYVKETINYSNEQKKYIVNKIITFLIIGITILLIILNVEHIIRLNKKYTYDFNNELVIDLKQQIKELEQNINKIKSNQGKYKDEDYQNIITNLDEILTKIAKSKILQYEDIQNLTLNDIYLLDVTRINYLNVLNIIHTLEKYDKNQKDYLELYRNELVVKIFLGEEEYRQTAYSYRYKLINIPNEKEPEYTYHYNDKIGIRIYDTQATITSYLYITKQIIEVGEIK